MLEIDAYRFVGLTNTLRAISQAGRVFPDRAKGAGEGNSDLATNLREQAGQLAEMRLPASKGAVLELADSVEHYGEYVDLSNAKAGFVCRILHLELEGRKFIQVERTDLYEQQSPIFGEKVLTEYPKAAYDISEAGKCLALGRGTACAFHLMRVIEVGIGRYPK
jgi:hypothetical protein